MKNISYLALLLIISFASCSKNSDNNDNTPPTPEEPTDIKLEYDVTFSNPLINKFFNNIKTSEGLPWQAYYDSWSELTSEENTELGDLFDENKGISIYLTKLPIIKNEILIKGDQVRGVSRGIAHEIQNHWNDNVTKGDYYIENLISNDKSLGFSYETNILGETGLVVTLDLEELTRTETNETITIDGITAKKITYTVKESELYYYEFKSMHVYVASTLNKSINLMHPFSTDEAGGIIKAEVEMKNEAFGTIIYELKKLQKIEVNNQDMVNSTPQLTLTPSTPDDFDDLYDKVSKITSFIIK